MTKPSHPKPRARKAVAKVKPKKRLPSEYFTEGVDFALEYRDRADKLRRGREMVWEDLEQPLRGRDIAPAGEFERYLQSQYEADCRRASPHQT